MAEARTEPAPINWLMQVGGPCLRSKLDTNKIADAMTSFVDEA